MMFRPSQNCAITLFERMWFRGPFWYECGVYWNRRDLVANEPLVEGEMIYMDSLAIKWRWRPFWK